MKKKISFLRVFAFLSFFVSIMNLSVLNLLAEQSVFAQLVIEKHPPTVSNAQKSSSTLYFPYDIQSTAVLSNIKANEYSITNLPPTIKTLPQKSIFDFIMQISEDSPDFRYVCIDSIQSNNTATSLTKLPNTSDELNVSLKQTSDTDSLKPKLEIAPKVNPSPNAANSLNNNSSENINEEDITATQ